MAALPMSAGARIRAFRHAHTGAAVIALVEPLVATDGFPYAADQVAEYAQVVDADLVAWMNPASSWLLDRLCQRLPADVRRRAAPGIDTWAVHSLGARRNTTPEATAHVLQTILTLVRTGVLTADSRTIQAVLRRIEAPDRAPTPETRHQRMTMILIVSIMPHPPTGALARVITQYDALDGHATDPHLETRILRHQAADETVWLAAITGPRAVNRMGILPSAAYESRAVRLRAWPLVAEGGWPTLVQNLLPRIRDVDELRAALPFCAQVAPLEVFTFLKDAPASLVAGLTRADLTPLFVHAADTIDSLEILTWWGHRPAAASPRRPAGVRR